jgi:hypothetical protein
MPVLILAGGYSKIMKRIGWKYGLIMEMPGPGPVCQEIGPASAAERLWGGRSSAAAMLEEHKPPLEPE